MINYGKHFIDKDDISSVVSVLKSNFLTQGPKIEEFEEAVEDVTVSILKEIVETHKNLLISSQNIIYDALNNEDLDLFKKANLALRYLSLIKGKDDISQKSLNNLNFHRRFRDLNFQTF